MCSRAPVSQTVLQTGHTGRALSSELPWAAGHKRLLGKCTQQREPDTKTHPPTNTRETKTALSHTPSLWRRTRASTWPERNRTVLPGEPFAVP